VLDKAEGKAESKAGAIGVVAVGAGAVGTASAVVASGEGASDHPGATALDAGAAAAGVKVPSKTGTESKVADVELRAEMAGDTAKSAAEDKAIAAAAQTAPGGTVVAAAGAAAAAKKKEQLAEIDVDSAKGKVHEAKRSAAETVPDAKKGDKGGGDGGVGE
jgi:hypothetical protein